MQKLQLLCSAAGQWTSNGTCNGSQLCDSAPGVNAGTCQDPIPQCEGQQPGYTFCVPSGGPELEVCGPDLVTVSTSVCPVACVSGACEPCWPHFWRCNGDQPQECESSGASWQNVGPACSPGACTSCANDTTCCP
jgi:hypothetical protein